MIRATMWVAVLGMLCAGVTGCSTTGALTTGGGMAWNLSKTDTHLRIWLDDQKAEQNTLKKAATGYSEWKIKEQVSTEPKLKFEIKDPAKLGRITTVVINVFQQFGADYSHQAEFIVAAKSNDSEAQMKPDTVYDLGKPGDGFRVINVESKDVDGIKLEPGKKYKLVLVVKADKSETAQIEFKTK